MYFPNFTEVGKLLLKAKLRFVRTKVQLAKQILQSIYFISMNQKSVSMRYDYFYVAEKTPYEIIDYCIVELVVSSLVILYDRYNGIIM